MRAFLCLMAVGLISAADPLAQVFEKAAAALSNGDYTGAEAGFQQVLKASPNHIGALGNLGVVYSRTDQIDKAIGVYRRALRLSPADKGLLLNLGLAYMKQESYADARPVFQSLVKAAPNNRQARELVATSDLYTGHVDEAVRSFEALRAQEPRNAGPLYFLGVGYLKQKQPEKAREALDAFLLTAPPVQSSLVLCRAYYESTFFDDAASHCRAALKIDPNFAGAHRELGKVLLSLRDVEASKELLAAVEQDPNDSEALYFLGGALLQEDRVAEAEPYLERARKLKPSFWGNYYYLGKAKFQRNQAAQAVPLLEAAALNPSESAVFYQLGRALRAAGRIADSNRAMQRFQELKAVQK